VLMGDFNASLHYILNDNRLTAIASVLDELNLVCCDNKNLNGVSYTYKHEGLGHRSFIDHVFVSASMAESVMELGVIDDGLNLSDHNAIVFKFRVSECVPVVCSDGGARPNVMKCHVRWTDENKMLYSEATSVLFQRLGALRLMCDKQSMCCSDVMHRASIEGRCNDIVNVLQMAAGILQQPGHSNQGNYNRSFQWDSELSRLKQQSIDIYELWHAVGRPRFGVINAERLRVKLLYKGCIRQQKRAAEEKRKARMAAKLASGEAKSFWRGWRSIKNGSKPKVKSIVYLVILTMGLFVSRLVMNF
jgi:hypothetical protein